MIYHEKKKIINTALARLFWSFADIYDNQTYIANFIFITDCGEIQVPVHGSVSYSSNRTTYQEVATFACDYGYFVSHDVKRTCEASGIWNGTTPDCIVRGKILLVKFNQI